MIASLLALSLLSLGPSVDGQARENLSETIYYASISASGSRLCDRKRSARYKRQFNRRYGGRISALMKYRSRSHGPDPDFIITSSCQRSLETGASQDRRHSQALNDFDATLRDLERRFGPVANGG
jgi:hypothetical protein